MKLAEITSVNDDQLVGHTTCAKLWFYLHRSNCGIFGVSKKYRLRNSWYHNRLSGCAPSMKLWFWGEKVWVKSWDIGNTVQEQLWNFWCLDWIVGCISCMKLTFCMSQVMEYLALEQNSSFMICDVAKLGAPMKFSSHFLPHYLLSFHIQNHSSISDL